MSTFTGYGPWIGSGTVADPYNHESIFQLSWRWCTHRILAGSSCYSPTDGTLLYTPDRQVELGNLSQSASRMLNVGSGVIARITIPDELDIFTQPLVNSGGRAYPVVAGDMGDFAAYARNRRAGIASRLASFRPDLDWTAPVQAAVQIIDEFRNGDVVAQRIWQHYRRVLNPNLGTPRLPDEMLTGPAGNRRANITRLTTINALPDDLTNQIRLADLCYEFIVYVECVRALTNAGY